MESFPATKTKNRWRCNGFHALSTDGLLVCCIFYQIKINVINQFYFIFHRNCAVNFYVAMPLGLTTLSLNLKVVVLIMLSRTYL